MALIHRARIFIQSNQHKFLNLPRIATLADKLLTSLGLDGRTVISMSFNLKKYLINKSINK